AGAGRGGAQRSGALHAGPRGRELPHPGAADRRAVLQVTEGQKKMLWKGFQKPKRLEVERETLTDTFGRFSAQPFERGFATTVGNTLRRVLLSSIEGAAITAVRVEGVLHEFSPIPGAMEDTTDLILNLKRLPLKMHVEHPQTLLLQTSTAGEVRAKHITPDPDLEILDPEAYIATLGQGSTLSVEMR